MTDSTLKIGKQTSELSKCHLLTYKMHFSGFTHIPHKHDSLTALL